MRYSYSTGKRYFVKSVSLCPTLSHITLVMRIYRVLKMGKGIMVYFTPIVLCADHHRVGCSRSRSSSRSG